MGERFFDFLRKVELIDFSLVEEMPFPKGKVEIDVSFVEGLPIKKEEIDLLKKIREESKILVALGNCAALGGIPEMKNYQGKERTIRFIYKRLDHILNPEIKEIDNFVKVDFVIPGCPINGEEFLKYAKDLIKGKIPEICQSPVCTECPLRGTQKCFLTRKKICFGLITLAGCGAICPKNDFPCLGCRGIFNGAKVKNFLKVLEKFHKKEEIEDNLEIFGIKDDVEKLIEE
jgi:sulfhydrogenase subunit delta